MSRIVWPLIGALIALSACSSARESNPPRTATEQLLLSSAADRAAERIALNLPAGSKVFVDATNFEGTDAKYAIGAIRDRMLRLGGKLAPDRDHADIVVEIRAGALSLDDEQTLVGIPKFDFPIPLTGQATFPEIALFKKRQRTGVAKVAATGYGAKDGGMVDSTDPQYGLSRETEWVVLFFISWSTNDYAPKEVEQDAGISVNVLRQDSAGGGAATSAGGTP
ncbi:MAG TPA: DUF6655 family protein [Alphaproteobacteria bacterium]|jgi:hypothetical protein